MQCLGKSWDLGCVFSHQGKGNKVHSTSYMFFRGIVAVVACVFVSFKFAAAAVALNNDGRFCITKGSREEKATLRRVF